MSACQKHVNESYKAGLMCRCIHCENASLREQVAHEEEWSKAQARVIEALKAARPCDGKCQDCDDHRWQVVENLKAARKAWDAAAAERDALKALASKLADALEEQAISNAPISLSLLSEARGLLPKEEGK